jgi:ubiquinone/menaquinone biosynthesis C-methylase UbiE
MAATMAFTRPRAATAERVRRSGVAPGQQVLDYACGPGYFTVVAARIVGPAGHVDALDIQPTATAMTARRARQAGLANVSTIVSACATRLTDGSVDVVLLYDAIEGIPTRRQVLGELARVLKPDGQLSVWVEHGDPADVVPLIITESKFVLRERRGDIVNFARRR